MREVEVIRALGIICGIEKLEPYKDAECIYGQRKI